MKYLSYVKFLSHNDSRLEKVKFSFQQVMQPPVFNEMTHHMFEYLFTVAKREMEDQYTSDKLKRMAIVKCIKVYEKSKLTFHHYEGIMYPSYPFFVPKESKLVKAILKYIHDRQDRYTVESNWANMQSQTIIKFLKFGKFVSFRL